MFESGVVSLNSEWGKVILGLPSIPHRGVTDATGQVTIEGVSPGLNQATLHVNDMDYKMPVTILPSPQAPSPGTSRGWNSRARCWTPGRRGSKVLVTLGYQGVGANPQNTTVTDTEGSFRMTGLGKAPFCSGAGTRAD